MQLLYNKDCNTEPSSGLSKLRDLQPSLIISQDSQDIPGTHKMQKGNACKLSSTRMSHHVCAPTQIKECNLKKCKDCNAKI